MISSGIIRPSRRKDPVLGLPGDTNLDGVVNAVDYMAVKRHMGKTHDATLAEGDLDHDQDVDFDDLRILRANLGRTAGQ